MAYFVLDFRYADMEARTRVRPQHLDYLNGLYAEGKVVLAGPLAEGGGAIVVYDVADEAEAQRLVEGDPYTAEGVAGDLRLREWNVVIPAPA